MRSGFSLRELRLIGEEVEDAVLAFADGLNVVAGPSDTGKTYVAQCLSFMLGGGKRPKEIPEATAYDTVRVTLIARDGGTSHALSRRLDGTGPVEHATGDGPVQPLRAQHDPKRGDTLPAFLLGLSGLSGRTVRTHAYGKTRPLAFSDVARLFLVDEETVISERSPILSGQNTDKLVERRVFRLVLTGEDDAGVVALEKPEIARSRRTARTEVLQELVSSVQSDLRSLEISGSVEEAEAREQEWAKRWEMAAAQLDRAREVALPVERRRREVLGSLRQIRSLAEHRSELQTRFALLRAQYESDLERLRLIEQAGGRLQQLTEERCPVCGAAAEHQQHEHGSERLSTDEIAASCRAEAAKIYVLRDDLSRTEAANDAELARLAEQAAEQEDALAQAERELSSVLQPQVGDATNALRQSEAGRSRERRATELLRRAAELDVMLADTKATTVPIRAEGSTEGASAADADAFTTSVERLLKSWHFPDVDRVTWSETDSDIVVSGRARASYGKGKRAIMRAAFNLGLLSVLAEQQRPSPGVVLIDSPLVVYREPDPGEEAFPLAVKQHFYKAVAAEFTEAQVVVFENDQPPASIADQAAVSFFTGTPAGRTGFIPR